MDTNDSLADISEFNGDGESETNSEGDTVHGTTTAGDVSDQQSDDDHTEEASTSLAPCEQSLFYLFPSYTEKIGSAQI